ncbi:T-complex protein [Nymphaea thermarum]|nr:T-complex protein [Nymphaea thermarum]
MASGVESPEKGRPAAIAFDVVACDTPASPPVVPERVRRRLAESPESKAKWPTSLEEIQAKLREADLRRQQFHEWLSSKAKPKPKSPTWSPQDEDLAQRLEAKLYAAEQKRLGILAQAQMRLARLDELRQAAKTGVQVRYEREREVLGSKVESRVQQAEMNRMQLLEAEKQRRAAAQERMAQSLLQRMHNQDRYKERINAAICQKRAAAEEKRLELLEAEKTRARATFMQARKVAKSVCCRREIERRKLKDKLEDRIQRARRQRAEYLRHRGSRQSSTRTNWLDMYKSGDFLSRKLARCWKQFLRSRSTTFALAKAYLELEINKKSVSLMPFEQLATRIESMHTLETLKALLDRFECRFMLSQSSQLKSKDIDHLLKRLTSPRRKGLSSSGSKARRVKKASGKAPSREKGSSEDKKMFRYPVRVVLCAYMILGHPEAVFSGHGEREVALAEAAMKFVREFEILTKIIIDGPRGISTSARQSSPNKDSSSLNQHSFRSQLAAFDEAWCSYLYRFVAWKIKDARSLEDDLVRAACQLELSMMQTCKLTSDGKMPELSHDMKAVRKQVLEDQRLLREKVQHLSGASGIERMESALSDVRNSFFEARENGSPLVPPLLQISSSPPGSSGMQLPPSDPKKSDEPHLKHRRVVRALFQASQAPPSAEAMSSHEGSSQLGIQNHEKLPSENEILVNEIIHSGGRSFIGNLKDTEKAQIPLQKQIEAMMEKAFWEDVQNNLSQDGRSYGRIVELVKEVRDELCAIAPHSWREEIVEAIDLDVFSQVLHSGTNDLTYLGAILEYVLNSLRKLAAPAKEDDMKIAHKNLLSELTAIANGRNSDSSFALATVKGLRYVLEQIKMLKQEISLSRIQLLEPIIRGTNGLQYLQRAFENRYGPPVDALNSLRLTSRWLSSVSAGAEREWTSHISYLSSFQIGYIGLPPATSLRTGGSSNSSATKGNMPFAQVTTSTGELECTGERVDVSIRLGLIQLVSSFEGINKDTLPETLKLNCARLRIIQSKLQKIIVICTSLLVLRQALLCEDPVPSGTSIETAVSGSYERLSDLLEREDVGILEIAESLEASCFEYAGSDKKLSVRKEVVTNMLGKSLQAGDAVFEKIMGAVHSAMRVLVLSGNGPKGKAAAEAALRRIGAPVLTDSVADVAEALTMVAVISRSVHGPWYACLVD